MSYKVPKKFTCNNVIISSFVKVFFYKGSTFVSLFFRQFLIFFSKVFTKFISKSTSGINLLPMVPSHKRSLISPSELQEYSAQKYSGITHTTQGLEEKLRKWYKGKIKIEKDITKLGNVIFSSAMSYEEAFRKEHSMAFFLRDAIFQAEEEMLPEKHFQWRN